MVTRNRMLSDNALRTENSASHTAQQYIVTMTVMFAMEVRQHLQLWKHMADNRRFMLEASSKSDDEVQKHDVADSGNFAPFMTIRGVPSTLDDVPEATVLMGPPTQGTQAHARPRGAGWGGGHTYTPPGPQVSNNDQELHRTNSRPKS
jgi:hypothetical protein